MSPREEPELATPLRALLGCRHPVVLAPMGGVGTPALAAAVSDAGGFGILPGMGVAPDDLRRRIHELRRRTDRPFGVNVVLHPDVRRPADPSRVARGASASAREALDVFRAALGLAPAALPREETPRGPDVDATIEVILEARPRVLSVGLGPPWAELVARCHARDVLVLAMVTRVADAVAWEHAGADAIVAQGAEAGGHRSRWDEADGERACVGTMVLVPEVAEAVRVPVLAAGGIVDGRGLAAALMLGAAGAFMGTRFLATRESGAPPCHVRAVVDAGSDSTTITDAFTGLPARVVRNRFVEAYRAAGAPALPPIWQDAARADIAAAAMARGDGDFLPLYAGQGVGMVRDVPAAGDVVRACVAQAHAALRGGARLAPS